MSSQKVILKALKEMNTIWHPESKLVFRSKTDKVVIGKYVNGEFANLDNECVELCKTWRFKYDENFGKEEPKEDEENEENEENEEDSKEDADEEDSKEDSEEDSKEEESKDEVVVAPITTPSVEVKVDDSSMSGSSQSEHVKSLTTKLVDIVTNLETENAKLSKALELKTQEFMNLTTKYATLNKKFVAIKELFI